MATAPREEEKKATYSWGDALQMIITHLEQTNSQAARGHFAGQGFFFFAV